MCALLCLQNDLRRALIMTKINDILNFFESFAPCENAMDFDNVGLLVGGKNTGVSKALLALDITKDVVLEAKQMGCELIISHHPVIFTPIKNLEKDCVPYLLAQNNISAICMHTNLDLSTEFGVNTCLAQAIGVKKTALADCGECLFVGTLENELPIDEFALTVKKRLDCKGLRYTDVKSTVKTVAISSGSGGSNIFDAAAIGADVLVTGEIKHHEINAANELCIDIIDAGHFKSEDIVILPLANKLSDNFSDITFTKSKAYDDYIKFI